MIAIGRDRRKSTETREGLVHRRAVSPTARGVDPTPRRATGGRPQPWASVRTPLQPEEVPSGRDDVRGGIEQLLRVRVQDEDQIELPRGRRTPPVRDLEPRELQLHVSRSVRLPDPRLDHGTGRFQVASDLYDDNDLPARTRNDLVGQGVLGADVVVTARGQ